MNPQADVSSKKHLRIRDLNIANYEKTVEVNVLSNLVGLANTKMEESEVYIKNQTSSYTGKLKI